MATSNAPPPEALDLVAYLNEAWTPYHAVLASCKRLMAAGFEASPRARPFFLLSVPERRFFATGGRPRSREWRARLIRETNAGSGAATTTTPYVFFGDDPRRRYPRLPLTSLVPRSRTLLPEKTDRLRRQEISERESWGDALRPGGKYFFTRNMSAVCAFAVGKKHAPGSGFVIIGAHTDSPCPRLKPRTKAANEQFLQVRVQNYGGGLWYTWFDRDLGVAGRVLVNRRGKDGNKTPKHELVRVDRPVMRISSLAIHLDRSLNDGFKVNFQQHMAPVVADAVAKQLGDASETRFDDSNAKRRKTSEPETEKIDATDGKHCPVLLELLAEQLDCDPGDILDFECQLCDTQPSAVGGARNEYVFSGRLDNLQSCHASLCALIRASSDASLEHEHLTRVMVHYDHEEVGSDSAQGAGSAMTEDALRRITRALAGDQSDDLDDLDARARRASFIVSADMAHAVHPNYADRHEPGHKPRFGAGVVIKHNANQRYATDAITGWLFREIGERFAKVPVQEFVVRSDLGCGSTIGPTLSTNTGIRTVDVGPPQLSMHSVREMCSAKDVKHAVDHYAAVYEQFGALDATLVVDGRIGNLCRPCGETK